MKYTIGIIAALSLCFILLSGVTNLQQRAATTEEQQSGASISGVLLAQDGRISGTVRQFGARVGDRAISGTHFLLR
jgi:hypothetical protein